MLPASAGEPPLPAASHAGRRAPASPSADRPSGFRDCGHGSQSTSRHPLTPSGTPYHYPLIALTSLISITVCLRELTPLQEDAMRVVFVVCAMLTICAGIAAQNAVRRDGDWEIKVEMQMPGMPMALPAQTVRQCITPQDVEDPQRSVPPSGRGQNSCKVSD